MLRIVGSFATTIADKIAQLADSSDGADVTWRAYVAQVGVDAQAATRRVTLQESVTRQADAARDSVSGVSVELLDGWMPARNWM